MYERSKAGESCRIRRVSTGAGDRRDEWHAWIDGLR